MHMHTTVARSTVFAQIDEFLDRPTAELRPDSIVFYPRFLF
jgi:hypothetical protein